MKVQLGNFAIVNIMFAEGHTDEQRKLKDAITMTADFYSDINDRDGLKDVLRLLSDDVFSNQCVKSYRVTVEGKKSPQCDGQMSLEL